MRRMGWALLAVLALTSGGRATAMAGRCKERNSSKDAWQQNDLKFEQCKERNQQRDGDNVFDQQGLVWWDTKA
jgi:hypothetical protein